MPNNEPHPLVAPTPAMMSGMTVASVPSVGLEESGIEAVAAVVAAFDIAVAAVPDAAVVNGGAIMPRACRSVAIPRPAAPICTLGLLITDWLELPVVCGGDAGVCPVALAGIEA